MAFSRFYTRYWQYTSEPLSTCNPIQRRCRSRWMESAFQYWTYKSTECIRVRNISTFKCHLSDYNNKYQMQKVNKQVQAAYESFANKQSKLIEQEEMVEMFQKLGVETSDPIIGYVLFLMKAKTNTIIQLEEFNNLFVKLKIETIADLKKKIPQLKKEYENRDTFKQVYLFLFDLYKEKELSKTIPFELAEALWKFYLAGRFKFLKKFEEYLDTVAEKKPVNKDTWRMIVEFEISIKEDLSNYNEIDGWPVFIDNFVNFLKK